ncbi:MAG: hypothetical protein M1592_00690 [Candidatus Thermoplasmatota archaeon]|nr:hypothetical protein [Candidatus Thermoplasmatota archaeon]MCL5881088.1 hypothetical protein [Candidatus Thermoplasmatota archaeon]
MSLFSKEPKKVVKGPVEAKKIIRDSGKKPKKQKSRFKGPTMENVETVVEVKTVGDIPPALEARKLIGENDLIGAAKVTFQAAKKDYSRYFGAKLSDSEGSRHFFINELSSMKIKVPENGYVDSFTIMEAFDDVVTTEDDSKNRAQALRKLLTFYLNFYEPARFAQEVSFDGDDLMNRFSEIYNYMDIMKLYFSDSDLRV